MFEHHSRDIDGFVIFRMGQIWSVLCTDEVVRVHTVVYRSVGTQTDYSDHFREVGVQTHIDQVIFRSSSIQ